MNKAVSLLELMVVVIIIGILATVAITQFSAPKEQVIEKEAKASLKLIAAAQKMYRLEHFFYANPGTTTAVNTNLRLNLVNTSSAKWNYSITADANSFNATATRINPSSPAKVFFINETMEDAKKQ